MLNLKSLTLPKMPKLNMNIFKSKSFFLLLVAALLIGLSIYMFKKYIHNKISPDYVDNKEFTTHSDNEKEDKEATLMLFHVNWCMYCKKAMPIWNEFKEDYEGKTVNGYKLYFKDYECSDENNEEVVELMDKYNIEGYPTIILLTDGEVTNFEAKPTYENLEKFIKSM